VIGIAIGLYWIDKTALKKSVPEIRNRIERISLVLLSNIGHVIGIARLYWIDKPHLKESVTEIRNRIERIFRVLL
jgi:hypothetical protein